MNPPEKTENATPPKPQIFKATYSGVPVYEMICNGVAVMRRREDAFMNATQILKVARFDKPKRTRILEREVQTGPHEKVQGGYGKYQGTWVSMERGIDLAEQYGAYEALKPIIEFRPEDNPSPPPAPKHVPAPPGTREPKIKRPRGRPRKPRPGEETMLQNNTYSTSEVDRRSQASTSTAEQNKQDEQRASVRSTRLRQASLARKRPHHMLQDDEDEEEEGDEEDEDENEEDDYGHDRHSVGRSRSTGRYPSRASRRETRGGSRTCGHVELDGPNHNAANNQAFNLDYSHKDTTSSGIRHNGVHNNHQLKHHDYHASNQSNRYHASQTNYGHNVVIDDDEDGNEDIQEEDEEDLSLDDCDDDSDEEDDDEDEEILGQTCDIEESPTSGESSEQEMNTRRVRASRLLTDHSLHTKRAQEYAKELLNYFGSDSRQIPPLLLHPASDLDIDMPIDDEGHTALHWAAATARIRLVRHLLNRGAYMRQVNNQGHTPLMRSVLFSNNFDLKTFPDLLEMLQRTVEMRDDQGRTVMHHVALTAGVRGKVHAARYYMDCLLEMLTRTLKDPGVIIDMQDENGDTTLHIAARISNRIIVKRLLDAGANTTIYNKAGESARSLILALEHRTSRPLFYPDGSHNIAEVSSTSSPGRTFDDAATSPGAGLEWRAGLSSLYSSARSLPTRASDTTTNSQSRTHSFLMPRDIEKVDQMRDEHMAELRACDVELQENSDTLASVLSRLEETRRQIANLSWQKDALRDAELEIKVLESRLKAQLARREYRAWHNSLKAQLMQCATTPDREHATSEAADEKEHLRRQIDTLKQMRESHLKKLVHLYGSAGSQSRIEQYRELVAACCGVELSELDTLANAMIAAVEVEMPFVDLAARPKSVPSPAPPTSLQEMIEMKQHR